MPRSSLAGIDSKRAVSWAPIRGQHVTWALMENRARSHSPAVREGRKVLLAAVQQALDSGVWTGAESLLGDTA